ncbi:hypothetical protein PILCRDRAFT_814447 [Piloderma croceum F 1598]|uniref:Uncharacterized protein n=1 Tax=Piloderma croceum (strain F 1598) TaxID=765440 RepID=A0A0C3BMN9_PILCF|nr:hypothetical protein PILCRDRAFT_814447 [Piloderma croceum F 1598]
MELVVAAVLKNLNLPKDISLAAMEQLNGIIDENISHDAYTRTQRLVSPFRRYVDSDLTFSENMHINDGTV